MTKFLISIGGVHIHGPADLAGEFVLLQLAHQAAEQLLQGTAPVRLQQQRDRPPCLDPLNAGCFDLFTHRFKETQRQFFIGGLGTQQGEAGGGRQPRGLPLLQCGMGKCRVALPDQQLQQGMVRVARLDEISCAMRSLARKSVLNRPWSASRMPTSVTLGK